jgi:hypothetical protein
MYDNRRDPRPQREAGRSAIVNDRGRAVLADAAGEDEVTDARHR